MRDLTFLRLLKVLSYPIVISACLSAFGKVSQEHYDFHRDAFNQKQWYFPPEKNGVIVSKGKFIYSVIDDFRILVGNQIIDFLTFKITVKQDPKTSDFIPQFNLNTPSFNFGEFTVFNDKGEKLYSSYARKLETASIGKVPTYKIIGAPLSTGEKKEMTKSSYLIACMERITPSAKIKVCTPELLPSSVDSAIIFQSSVTSSSFESISVNGHKSTNSGEIVLGSKAKPIEFLAQLKSKAKIEISLKRSSSDVFDFSQNRQNNTFKIITNKFYDYTEALSQKRNSFHLFPQGENFFYLNAASGLPLRYDLFFDNPAPYSSDRITYNSTDISEYPKKTYLSSVQINLPEENKNLIITPENNDPNNPKQPLTEVLKKSISVTNLQKGEVNYTDVKVVKPSLKSSPTFQRWYVHRYYPFSIDVSSGARLDSNNPDASNNVYNQFNTRWWLPLQSINWHLEFEHNTYSLEENSESTFLVNYSFSDMFHSIEDNIGIGLGYGSINEEQGVSSFYDFRFFFNGFNQTWGIRNNFEYSIGIREFPKTNLVLNYKKYIYASIHHRIFFLPYFGMKWGVNFSSYNVYTKKVSVSNNGTEGQLGLFFYF